MKKRNYQILLPGATKWHYEEMNICSRENSSAFFRIEDYKSGAIP
jgi:hypothetical protein